MTQEKVEVGVAEAAELLGMPSHAVCKLMNEQKLAFRTVGTRHYIIVASINVFLRVERVRMEVRMEELSALQNELGLLE